MGWVAMSADGNWPAAPFCHACKGAEITLSFRRDYGCDLQSSRPAWTDVQSRGCRFCRLGCVSHHYHLDYNDRPWPRRDAVVTGVTVPVGGRMQNA